ncbi:MAG: hypothetical protein ACR2PT_20530 [Endozoicomonas sp.]
MSVRGTEAGSRKLSPVEIDQSVSSSDTADSPGKTRKGRKVLTSSPEKKLHDQQPPESGKPDLSLRDSQMG